MKRVLPVFLTLLLISLAACSSPEEKAASYIESANELVEAGDLTKAEIEFKNALQVNQNLPDAWFGLAKVHEARQEWRQAYNVLNRVREINPKHLDSRIMLGQMLLASNQIDQALNDTGEILEFAPKDSRSHALMAAVQFRLGNFDEARVSINRALKIDSSNDEALLVRARILIAEKKFDEAIVQLDKAIGSSPEKISMYLMKIQAYTEQNDSKAVESVYGELINRFPDRIAFRHALMRSYLQRNEIDSAEKVLEEIIEIEPDNKDEKIRLVAFKQQFRSPEDAIALLQRFIAQDKSSFRFRFSLGELYEREGQADAARDVYQRVADDDGLQPNGLAARNKLALLHLRSGELEKARTIVTEVLEHDKANENALLMQAGFKINDRNFDDAIIDLRTILRDNPESLKALVLLGQAYQSNGSRELSLETYAKAFQINPGNPQAANRYAVSLMQQNNPEQADEVMQQSVSSGNKSINALKILADIKLRLGNWEEAEYYAQQLKDAGGQEALSEQVMGVVFQSRQQQSESIEAFKRAHELAPAASQPLVSLVRSYVNNGQVAEARQFLESVLKDNDKNLNAMLLLGQLALLESRTDDAIKRFNKIIEINPRADIGYRNLSALYLRNNRLDKAEAITKQGIEAMPDNVTLSTTLASIYERRGEFDKAIGIYESMLERNSELIIARNNLASLLTDHGSDQASLDRARQMAAALKDSRIPQFRDTYAWAAVRSGTNLEEAIVILEGVVKENEQVGVYHYHLGEAYRKKGDMKNAMALLEKAVSLEKPDSAVTTKAKQALSQIN